MDAIRLSNVTLYHPHHTHSPILNDVTGEFQAGSLTAVYGPNGAGKTMLMKTLAGLIKPDQGCVDYAPSLHRDVSFVPQISHIDRGFAITVADFVALGAGYRVGLFSRFREEELRLIEHSLERVGLHSRSNCLISELSGGQMQRLLIARLILRDPKVVLLDEPFSAIDNDALPLLMQVILDFIADGKTVIAVSHDQNQIRTYFPQTLLLSGRVVYWGDTATALNPENLSKARELALKGF